MELAAGVSCVAIRQQVDACDQYGVRVESGVESCAALSERTNKRSAHEQHETDRDLRDDEGAAQPLPGSTTASASRFLFEGTRGVGPR